MTYIKKKMFFNYLFAKTNSRFKLQQATNFSNTEKISPPIKKKKII